MEIGGGDSASEDRCRRAARKGRSENRGGAALPWVAARRKAGRQPWWRGRWRAGSSGETRVEGARRLDQTPRDRPALWSLRVGGCGAVLLARLCVRGTRWL